ncbi:MAG: lipopolysaccharide heptosyltransferase I [Gammaproteobacteria bacterium]|nr:lipopolysaccharide heptosyltransferase I [Gammaproteobacteria bacterium]MCW5582345.1 lipopolysaccharide heptosyltransferase I [Gammaproteobacteria bacterium]
MRVLLIKTSSMGDIIHTLPALTDAGIMIPGISFDWVVEDGFASIPSWHPKVDRVIPVALRRWRKGIFSRDTRKEWKRLREQLQEYHYDLILDAQGLVKSAFLTLCASGTRVGLDWQSARESLASWAYQRKYKVNFYQHAIVRMRELFSQALGYQLPGSLPDFGLDRSQFQPHVKDENYLVFLYGTTWTSKQWPESHWRSLAGLASQCGYRVKMSGNNVEEIEKAERIAEGNPAVEVLPRLGISAMATLLANAKTVVAVDTGLGHLAAALGVTTISIYGSTNPHYTGALGMASVHLTADFPCVPCLSRTCQYRGESAIKPACYATISPARVWAEVSKFKQYHPCNPLRS